MSAWYMGSYQYVHPLHDVVPRPLTHLVSSQLRGGACGQHRHIIIRGMEDSDCQFQAAIPAIVALVFSSRNSRC